MLFIAPRPTNQHAKEPRNSFPSPSIMGPRYFCTRFRSLGQVWVLTTLFLLHVDTDNQEDQQINVSHYMHRSHSANLIMSASTYAPPRAIPAAAAAGFMKPPTTCASGTSAAECWLMSASDGAKRFLKEVPTILKKSVHPC